MIKGIPHAHEGPIWYQSEPSDVPCSPNQFLSLDFFCRFLQQDSSNWTSLLFWGWDQIYEWNQLYHNYLTPILLYFSRLSAIALKKHSAETHEKYLQVCNICQAAFETYNQLKEHRNTVHREKKKTIHSCPHCEKQFEIKKTMTYHMFNVHGDEKVAHFRLVLFLSLKNISQFQITYSQNLLLL